MNFFIENLKNKLDFFLRNKLYISRKNYSEKNEEKDGILKTTSAINREKYLFETYNLIDLKNHSTRQNYLENLYTIDLLDRHLHPYLQPIISPESAEHRFAQQSPQGRGEQPIAQLPSKILDIGCKNWFYAKGEHYFFKKHFKQFNLVGIELDANRVCTNFFSRKEIAKFHIKNLENTYFIDSDFLQHNDKYDYLIWFLPFIFEYPHLKWGLPLSYFKPEKMLKHAYNSLNENGILFIINQGEDEFKYQQKLCKSLKIPFNPIGEIESEFLSYKIKRYLTIIQK